MMKDNGKMPVSRKGLLYMIAGVMVLLVGFVLLAGGGSDDPAVFNTAMFDFRRLYLAPLVMICGIVIVTVAIMRTGGRRRGR